MQLLVLLLLVTDAQSQESKEERRHVPKEWSLLHCIQLLYTEDFLGNSVFIYLREMGGAYYAGNG